jgi:hypothetical protein
LQKEERLNENLTFVQSGLEVLKSMDHYSYTKKDLLVALCLFLFVVMIAACRLTAGYSVWDDDPSAYMNEGIAISEGRFWEQAVGGKMILPPHGKEFFTHSGKKYFT